MAEEKQAWEKKYEADAKKCSQEITKLKFKLRAERIERAELRPENQAVQNAIRALEQSLEEHKDYIFELQEDSVRRTVEFDRALAEAWRDRDYWRAQYLARQLYIKQTIEQINKAICKAHKMFDKAKAFCQSFVPIERNRQQLLNFIEEVKDHYEQVKAFYGYNYNMLNNV